MGDLQEYSEEELREKRNEFLEKFKQAYGEEQLEIVLNAPKIIDDPKLVLSILKLEDTDLSGIKPELLREVRDKINRQLEDREGLTMSEEEIMDTKVKNLTGVEAAKGIKMISEEVERDLRNE